MNTNSSKFLIVAMSLGFLFGLSHCSSGSMRPRAKMCDTKKDPIDVAVSSAKFEKLENETKIPFGEYNLKSAEVFYKETRGGVKDLMIYAKDTKDKSGSFKTSFGCARGLRAEEDLDIKIPAASDLVMSNLGLLVKARDFSINKTGFNSELKFSANPIVEHQALKKVYGDTSTVNVFYNKDTKSVEVRSKIIDGIETVSTFVIYEFKELTP